MERALSPGPPRITDDQAAGAPPEDHKTRTKSRTISVEEAAEMLGIGRTSGYAAARAGNLPGVIRIGRRVVVSRDAIERLLAGQ